MSNELLVAPASPAATALSVYPVPARLMLKLLNVATPFTTATVVVPESVPPLGFVPIATLTAPLNLVSVSPAPLRAVTCTAGVIAALDAVLLGGR